MDRLEKRVVQAAEVALAEKRFVAPVDVLIGLGWLPPSRVDHWCQGRVEYVARTRDRRPLCFSKSGDPSIERAYRTHWISPELPEKEREKLAGKVGQAPDLVVIWALREWTCTGCGGTGNLLIMEDPGPLCMGCAGMAHLEYLPAGDAGLTRRAKKASTMSAVVVRFSRSRRRYERQGILVEPAALDQARRD